MSYIASEPKAQSATRGRMTEVYFNGGYRGIYCITERIDRKQLRLDETNGYLYKGENWATLTTFFYYDINNLPIDGEESWGGVLYEGGPFRDGWKAEYPKFPYTKWEPIVDLVQFVCDSDDETFIEGISKRFDIDNLVDFFIFNAAVASRDNVGKNTFMSIYNRKIDKRFFYLPWDLDACLGQYYPFEGVEPGFILGQTQNNLMRRMAITNSDNYGQKVQKRWAELKNDIYSREAIIERFREYQEELEGSGAYERESNMWTVVDMAAEINRTDIWLKEHLIYIDKYIQDLDNNVGKLQP